MTHARKNTKSPPAEANWEAEALRRIAPRVESLPETPPEGDDFGWEKAVLENLRRRLAANE